MHVQTMIGINESHFFRVLYLRVSKFLFYFILRVGLLIKLAALICRPSMRGLYTNHARSFSKFGAVVCYLLQLSISVQPTRMSVIGEPRVSWVDSG